MDCVQTQHMMLQAEVALVQPAVADHAVLHGVCMKPTHVAAGRGGVGHSAVAEHAVLRGLCANSAHMASQQWQSMLLHGVYV